MEDRQGIYQVVMRYCRGVDRLDMNLVRSAYHEGAIHHHTGFSGPIEKFLPIMEQALRLRFLGTMHIIGNHLTEVCGDVAISESYGTAVHWGDPPDDPERNFTTGIRYIDHMARHHGRWGIIERWGVREWVRHDRVSPATSITDLRARRDSEDPLWRLRRRLNLGKENV